jgi:hypothetical protein
MSLNMAEQIANGTPGENRRHSGNFGPGIEKRSNDCYTRGRGRLHDLRSKTKTSPFSLLLFLPGSPFSCFPLVLPSPVISSTEGCRFSSPLR